MEANLVHGAEREHFHIGYEIPSPEFGGERARVTISEEHPGGVAMAVRDTAHRKLTYEDYLLFPEDRQRHEIFDGEHYVTPAPSMEHQGVSMNLSAALHSFLRKRKLGR